MSRSYIETGHVNSSADDHVDELVAGIIISKENLSIEDLVFMQDQLDQFLRTFCHRNRTGDANTTGFFRLNRRNVHRLIVDKLCSDLEINIGPSRIQSNTDTLQFFLENFSRRSNRRAVACNETRRKTRCPHFCFSPLVASSIIITISAVRATAITCRPRPLPTKI